MEGNAPQENGASQTWTPRHAERSSYQATVHHAISRRSHQSIRILWTAVIGATPGHQRGWRWRRSSGGTIKAEEIAGRSADNQGEWGPIDVETTNEGDASGEVEGNIFGRLENLTAAPLTVTFNFNVGSSIYTHVDCFDCDFASADIFASFQIGDWFDFYQAKSFADGPALDFGFTGGDVQVTIPARSVIQPDIAAGIVPPAG
jgi:hypothetical protein